MSRFMGVETIEGTWYEVEHDHTDYVPADLIGEIDGLDKDGDEVEADELGEDARGELWAAVKDYIECRRPDRLVRVIRREGWGARFSAPGYMDATEWVGVYDTEEEAEAEVREQHGDENESWRCMCAECGTDGWGDDFEDEDGGDSFTCPDCGCTTFVDYKKKEAESP